MTENVKDRPRSVHEHIFLMTKQERYFYDADAVAEKASGSHGGFWVNGGPRNQRNVWTISTTPFPEAHFATFPPEIPRRCIKAGGREGDTVLDPFGGSMTTLMEAKSLKRNGIAIELNPEYAEMGRRRIYPGGFE